MKLWTLVLELGGGEFNVCLRGWGEMMLVSTLASRLLA
jgi:hypothetical protein